MRILVVSCVSNPGHELRNARVAIELLRRGHDVIHVGPSSRINVGNFFWPTYSDDFVKHPIALEARSALFHSWPELHRYIAWADIVLLGTGKGYADAGNLAQRLGKLVIQHRDVGGLDPVYCSPDVLMVPGAWEQQAVLTKEIPLRTLPIITGCVQYDDAALHNSRFDRDRFFEKHGLNPGKKLATYLTQGPAHHNPANMAADLRNIDAILASGTHSLILKLHPNDYFGAKSWRWHKDVSGPIWENLGRSLVIARPEDKYDCFRHSDVIISRGSTTALETPLVGRPMLLVDCAELVFSDQYDTGLLKRWFPEPRFSRPGLKSFSIYGCLDSRLEEIPDPEVRNKLIGLREWDRENWGRQELEYIGSECTSEELPAILKNELYQFDDGGVYDAFVAKYAFANDGRAYLRVAEAVEKMIAHPELGQKARQAARQHFYQVSRLRIRQGLRTAHRRAGDVKSLLLRKIKSP